MEYMAVARVDAMLGALDMNEYPTSQGLKGVLLRSGDREVSREDRAESRYS